MVEPLQTLLCCIFVCVLRGHRTYSCNKYACETISRSFVHSGAVTRAYFCMSILHSCTFFVLPFFFYFILFLGLCLMARCISNLDHCVIHIYIYVCISYRI